MRVSKLLGQRFKNPPSDCVIESHALMARGGYMKYMANGIYSLYMPGRRIVRKIEAIIRDEMDRADGQEVLFPVAMPASLWEESGRYESIGSELARWTDRSGNKMVLGMTHEEAAVHLARDTAASYADYPFMIYQIQTKFRDEPRARGGLIRVREFTMKDAYSFHTSKEDLERYYAIQHKAYENIFRRAGAKNVISVKSDSGMMGGSVSHEFMLLTEVGEDTLAICPECGYSANMEVASCDIENDPGEVEELRKVSTPGTKTIEALKQFI
ncbi:MAG: proline--tRNA ligase, partial [Clostridia bacterium]|nr:proline--tRNA ligase [Clostridia bacterium]